MLKGLTLLAAQEMGDTVKRRATALGFYVAAGLVAGVGAVYALNALRDWLGVQYGLLYANLIVAAGLMAVAVVLAIVGVVARKRRASRSGTATTAAILAAPLAVKTLGRMNLTTLAAIGVLVAGAYLGRQAAKS